MAGITAAGLALRLKPSLLSAPRAGRKCGRKLEGAMFEPAERLKNVKVSASAAMTRKVRELRAQGVKIVGLSSGEPDFTSPAHAIEAAHQAALAGDTKYPPQDGALRAQEGGAEEVQARQQPRLRARRDHGLQRQQADHVRRHHGVA